MTVNNNIINLNSLLDLTAKLYESVDEHFILNSTLLSLMGKLKIIRGAVLIKNNPDYFIPLIIKGNYSFEKIYLDDISEFKHIDNDTNIDGIENNSFHYIIPVRKSKDTLYAVILLGKSISELDVNSEEIDYINLITAITANAINNARNFKSYKNEKVKVEKQNQLLTTLFEISKDFSKHFNAEQIVRTLALNLMGQLTVTRFALFSKNDKGQYIEIVNRFGQIITSNELDYFEEIDFAQAISDCNLNPECLKYVLKNDIKVIAPLIVQGERRGLLIIGKKLNGTEFTDENLLFVEAIGNSAMSALENERLFREELEKKRLENELSIALEIQKNLLPDCSPKMNHFDITGMTIPSRHVGGDLYDFIPLNDGSYLIAIADVSGKGIPASLIMANFQAALRVLAMSDISLSEIVVKINNLLYHNTSSDKFVTSFFAIIDDYSGKITYINAGHNPPIVRRRNGDIEWLTTGGLILGFMEYPFEYQVGEIYLHNDEFIIFYTDGVTEAAGSDGIDYGESRLEDYLKHITKINSGEIMDGLIHSVRNYLSDAPQNDDITIIVSSRK
jgi:sigma-B regulation protein RsbU (phosphoserine phosphatase)